MKLAFLAAANSPHTIKWVNALSEQGHEISIYSMPDHKQEQGEIEASVKIEYLPFESAQNGAKKNVKAASAIAGADAVVAIDMGSYGFLAAKAKLQNLLLVATGLDIFVDIASKKSMIIKAIKSANVVLATAPNVISQIKEKYKKEKEYCVAPFGVDMQIFKKTGEKPEKPCFGSIKALESVNNVDLVLEAFAKYIKSGADATLKIVGTGTKEAELKSKAQQLGIADKVEFLGYVKNKELPEIIGTMDAVVQMTSIESLGVSAIEAMACEVPVIASDTFGASEYILNHVTGYLIKVGNTDACADKMANVTKNRQAAKKMGEGAREDVMRIYELKDCVKKFEDAVQKAAR